MRYQKSFNLQIRDQMNLTRVSQPFHGNIIPPNTLGKTGYSYAINKIGGHCFTSYIRVKWIKVLNIELRE